MQIVSLGNSGFALLWDDEMLVIDCYNPKSHAILSAAHLKTMRNTTFFVSHAHSDHYSKQILEYDADFVMGYDIDAPKHAIIMRPGDERKVNGMRVQAFGSTDEGVSFAITWRGKTIFHAGDLNDWHWRDEGGEEYANKAEAWFKEELSRVQKGVSHIDIAFFPVDPRMGSDYYRGAVLFYEAIRPKLLIPMHYRGAFTPPEDFYKEMQGANIQAIKEKESITLR